MAMLLTYLRFVLIIPFAVCFFVPPGALSVWAMPAALILFALAAVTDFLDGWVARRFDQTSALGAALDPIADKALIVTALILLVETGALTGFGSLGALVIIAREIIVSGLREALAPRGLTLPVTGLAKAKTAAQSLAIAALLAAVPGGVLPMLTGATHSTADAIAMALYGLAVILTIYTGAGYTWQAVKLLRETP
ncbi:MAG: CDP-diacylglycerol--glycerol-3-phosphate 3-phosphatidyltransferase [Pseudomonadota bacterium]